MTKKVAVISGAAGAIGSAIVTQLTNEGYIVVGLTRADCDFDDPEAVAKAIGDVAARYGHKPKFKKGDRAMGFFPDGTERDKHNDLHVIAREVGAKRFWYAL
jgi:NAD(P)-dependent dehydrogenase (short-subunit alcohol dehydrogenase family)